MYGTFNNLEMGEIIEDAAATSQRVLGKRPGGKRLQQLIKAGGVTGVVITRLDRAFRSTTECLTTVEAWEKLGVVLHCIDFMGMMINTKSSTGKFILTIFAASAEMERMLVSERTKAALGHKRRKGELTTRPDRMPYGKKLTRDKKVVRCEAEQKVIAKIQSMRASGWSYPYIVDQLIVKGIKFRGQDRWHATTIKRILKRIEKDGA